MGFVVVEVPEGVWGGETIEFFSAEHGMQMQTSVPIGLQPGDAFHVQLSDADTDDYDAGIMEQVSVVIPEGVMAGQSIEVQTHDSSWIQIQVPIGYGPADVLAVDVLRHPKKMDAAPTGVPLAATTAAMEPALVNHKQTFIYRAGDLRVPVPESGYAFFRGQHITMRRSDGRLSNGVVLETIDGYEPLYRCRIGDHSGTLEKFCTGADLERARPQPGFAFAVGDMVRVARKRDHRLVLGTVLAPTYEDEEPCYRLRLEPANEDEDGGAIVETHSEDDISMKMLTAPSSAFSIGQLVQVRQPEIDLNALESPDGTPDGYGQLARVVGLEKIEDKGKGPILAYRCQHVEDGWGFPPPG